MVTLLFKENFRIHKEHEANLCEVKFPDILLKQRFPGQFLPLENPPLGTYYSQSQKKCHTQLHPPPQKKN